MADNSEVKMQATLGLTGLTMNAMALIAPGAFLWLTFCDPGDDRRDRAGDVDRHLSSRCCCAWRPRFVTRKWRSSIRAPAVPTTSRNNRS